MSMSLPFRVSSTLFLLAVGLVASTLGAEALALSQVAKLAPHADGLPGDPGAAFGHALALDGDTAVVGAPYDDSQPTDGGAVYVLARSGGIWTVQQKLLGDDGYGSDWFGFSVALSGDTLVVGSPVTGTEAAPGVGAAYVFVRSGASWTRQQKLVAPSAVAEEWFGASVAISGQTAVIGAPFNTSSGPGSAYVFVRSGTVWSQQQKLLASNGLNGDHFGLAVALDGETAVVGAPYKGASTGAVYAFLRSGTTWVEQQVAPASSATSGDRLGTAVAVSGDTLVAGAIADDAPTGVGAGAAFVFVRSGSVWVEQQKLSAGDGATGDNFGVSVALSGATAVVGAACADPPAGADAGAGYVFVRSGAAWSPQQKLVATGGVSNDRLGQAVAASGDTVLIGAPTSLYPEQRPGTAFAFVRSGVTWSQQQRLVGNDNAGFDLFGSAVDIDGATLAVGARFDDTAAGPQTGAAIVFVRSPAGWLEQQKLTGSDVQPSASLGVRLALDGDTLAVAAIDQDTPAGEDAGAVYVFVRSGTTWSEQQKLTASDGAVEDYFGRGLALDGNTLAVGAALSDTAGGADAGAVYVFVRSGTAWTLQQKLVAAGGGAGDRFGQSLALLGDRLFVGAPLDDTPAGTDAGSVRVFERTGTTWSEAALLAASDAAPGDWFGISVALAGDTLAVSAFLDDTPAGINTGSAYVFQRAGGVWLEQQQLLAPDAAQSDWFGGTLAFGEDLLAVGVDLRETPAGTDAGAAYVFARAAGVWSLASRLVARDAAASDRFGSAVAAQGSTVVTGAVLADHPGAGAAGAAYVFEPVLKGDLDHDLRTDLLFRNNPGAFHEAWVMNGVVRTQAQRIVPDLADPTWQVAGVDDFDADGRNDLVLSNSVSGAVEFWLMNGSQRLGTPVALSGAPVLAPAWKLSATGDFNADGNPDLVWRNATSQAIVIWTLRGTTKVGGLLPSPGQAAHANWEIVAALDFNGDGARDLLWYNRDSGKLVQWLMDGNVVRFAGLFTTPANAGNANWKVLAGGDYGVGPAGLPGTNDVVWRNADSGRIVVWYMDLAGNRTSGTFTTPDAPSPNPLEWTVSGPR